ncbi:hypothetical protein D3C85_1097470 [compost metagenome]
MQVVERLGELLLLVLDVCTWVGVEVRHRVSFGLLLQLLLVIRPLLLLLLHELQLLLMGRELRLQFLALRTLFLKRGQRHLSFAALRFPLCVTGCRVLNIVRHAEVFFRHCGVELFDSVRHAVRQRLTIVDCVRHADRVS